MGDYYLLVGGEVMPCGLFEWAQRDHNSRVIAQDHLDKFWVSTVFLGLDHGFPNNPERPLVFETMVFVTEQDGEERKVSDWGELYCARYSTLSEAEAGHKIACAWVDVGHAAEELEERRLRDNADHHEVPSG